MTAKGRGRTAGGASPSPTTEKTTADGNLKFEISDLKDGYGIRAGPKCRSLLRRDDNADKGTDKEGSLLRRDDGEGTGAKGGAGRRSRRADPSGVGMTAKKTGPNGGRSKPLPYDGKDNGGRQSQI